MLFLTPNGRFEERDLLTIDKEEKHGFLGLVACIREHNLCRPRLCILARVRRVRVWTTGYLQQRFPDAGSV